LSLYVLDASVVLKWFLPEPGFEAAQKLRRPDVECEAPDLLLLEACNALWKHVRRGAVDAAVADAAAAALAEAPITWPSDTLFAEAYGLAIETGRTVYDSTTPISATRHAAHIQWVENV
jgi:predicted nucleic acid-binding protein